jgi:hypothetical protein
MKSRLHRLPDGSYVVSDDEFLTICTPSTCMDDIQLIATAFRTRESGWRLLRYGCVDVGYSPTPEDAVSRLMNDAARHAARRRSWRATACCALLLLAPLLVQGGSHV